MRLLLAILITLVFGACKRGSRVGDAPIPFDSITVILQEFHLEDAYTAQHYPPTQLKSQDSLASLFYQRSLAKRGYTAEDFQQSYAYYRAEPLLMDSLYSKLINNFNMEVARANQRSQFKAEPARPPKSILKRP